MISLISKKSAFYETSAYCNCAKINSARKYEFGQCAKKNGIKVSGTISFGPLEVPLIGSILYILNVNTVFGILTTIFGIFTTIFSSHTLTPKNFGGTNIRIFFCPNIYPPKFCQIRNFFRPKFLVFRILLKNQLLVNLMINNAFPPLDATLQ